jgi:hypothetical protein
VKKFLLLIVLLFSQSLFAQESPKITTFSRLLIFNEKSELMVVKIKNSNQWVTPGWYQDDSKVIKDGLSGLADSYGIVIDAPVLCGVFTLKSDVDKSISTRLYFTAKMSSGVLKKPDIIDEIRWLPINEASKIITFPHISMMTRQVVEKPNVVWGGSLLQYKEDGLFKAKLIENFYPLFEAK